MIGHSRIVTVCVDSCVGRNNRVPSLAARCAELEVCCFFASYQV